MGLPALSAEKPLLMITRCWYYSTVRATQPSRKEGTKISFSFFREWPRGKELPSLSGRYLSPANIVMHWTWHYTVAHSIQYYKLTFTHIGIPIITHNQQLKEHFSNM